ncbi:hypothetical protein SAICODRAFT_73501 [Saitoella complicata NRRL Y-17804]|uniref:ML-like domain-containing protein n=1 Tax=Saitoella complicata (strain BCRC 22490 / CBS 7301 / JCM 7358 / NBRC 10748 / NRRL Y-17804) TaxID=698492 RepID=A0A0E9NLE0_SAICN|nr:uncharacterized protein SAICODRAFT_73501 [Saitoella complicata NRRL Y-17804]ODQ50216.1 hypothetical protein SAICODRAFT_73501 [Saitoella complicata NRRL Y-17804]GAO50230.1 hypothetical protein G7K_4362-t1 [Saitoella complicata NRRL Y-17804]
MTHLKLLPLLIAASASLTQAITWTNCHQSTSGVYFDPSSVSVTYEKSGGGALMNALVNGTVYGEEIVDTNTETNKLSTLFANTGYLSTEVTRNATRFCDRVVPREEAGGNTTQCPIPSGTNTSFLIQLPLANTYAFTTLYTKIHFVDGASTPNTLGCISFNLTPSFPLWLTQTLRYFPLFTILLTLLATLIAASWFSSLTLDPIILLSNFGVDPEGVRLCTPGPGEVWGYVQWVLLSGGLGVAYPGFYQGAVSSVGWSGLLFNQTLWASQELVSPHADSGGVRSDILWGEGWTGRTYALTRLSNLVGLRREDMWGTHMIWLSIVAISIFALCAIGLVVWMILKKLRGQDDVVEIRRKNGPFVVGMLLRVFLLFYFPLTVFTTYQLVITATSSAVKTAFAVVTMVVVLLGLPGYLVWAVRRQSPNILYDDQPTLLALGPLYNTFRESESGFCWWNPILFNLLRGIIIGAGQRSGVAQIIVLALLEVVNFGLIRWKTPWQGRSGMNVFHGALCLFRLVEVLLMVAFIPSLNVSEGNRGWVGYVILALHAFVLVFFFLLGAGWRIIEIVSRLVRGGGKEDYVTGPGEGLEGGKVGAREMFGLGKVFGIHQLAQRKSKTVIDSDEIHTAGPVHTASMSTLQMQEVGTGVPSSATGFVGTGQRPMVVSRGSSALALLDRAGGQMSSREDIASAYSIPQVTPTTPTAPGYAYPPQANSEYRWPVEEVPVGQPGAAFFRPPRKSRQWSSPMMGPGAGSQTGSAGVSVGSQSPAFSTIAQHSRGNSYGGDYEDFVQAHGGTTSASSMGLSQIPEAVAGPSMGRRGVGVQAPDVEIIGAYDNGRHEYVDVPFEEYYGDVDRPRNVDYAVRESDIYKQSQQPLSSAPSARARKLGTGPADPTGPVAAAQGLWGRLSRLYERKEKGKTKGFEVVRSAPARVLSPQPRAVVEPASPRSIVEQEQQRMDEAEGMGAASPLVQHAAEEGREWGRTLSPVSDARSGATSPMSDSLPGQISRGPPVIPEMEPVSAELNMPSRMASQRTVASGNWAAYPSPQIPQDPTRLSTPLNLPFQSDMSDILEESSGTAFAPSHRPRTRPESSSSIASSMIYPPPPIGTDGTTRPDSAGALSLNSVRSHRVSDGLRASITTGGRESVGEVRNVIAEESDEDDAEWLERTLSSGRLE